MRVFSLIWIILLLSTAAMGQAEDDTYQARLVRDAIESRSGAQVVIRSVSQKQLARLGDRVAIAITKIMPPQDIVTDGPLKAVLSVIEDAFAEPRSISLGQDRSPSVTLLLLAYLNQNVTDDGIKRNIEDAIIYVKQKTNQSQP